MTETNLVEAKKAFFLALGIDIAVTAISAASDFWVVVVLHTVADTGQAASQSDIDYIELWRKFSALLILSTLWVGWKLTKWIDACYAHAKQNLELTGFKNEKWKTWGWIVPGVNLYKPYQVLSELYKTGSSKGISSDDWRKSSGSAALLIWWIFWCIAHMLTMAAFKAMRKSSSENQTLNQIISNYNGAIFICFASIVVAGLWFWVAGKLTNRLLNCSSFSVNGAARSSTPVQVKAPTAATNAQASNEAYAVALAEIEEGRVIKSTWAKCYAESDGDDAKTKARYIKARVGEIGKAAVWVDTQPPVSDVTHTSNSVGAKSTDERQSSSNVPLSATSILIIVVILAILVAVGRAAYQHYTQQNTVAATPTVDLAEGIVKPPNLQATAIPPLDGYIAELKNLPRRERYNRLEKDMGVKFPMQLGNLVFQANYTSKNAAMAEGVEHTQMWGARGNRAFIVFQNRTYQQIRGIVLEMQAEERQCDNKGNVYYLNLFFEKPVPATTVSGVSFTLPDYIPNSNRCMDVVDLIYD
jgi:hypothetical protein